VAEEVEAGSVDGPGRAKADKDASMSWVQRGPNLRFAWEAVLGSPPLPPGVIDELSRVGMRVTVAAGETVLRSSDPADDIVLLLQGDVARGTLTPVTGAAAAPTLSIERSLSAPGWVDAASAWRPGSYLQDVQASTDAVVLKVPKAALSSMLLHHPELAIRLLQVLAEQVEQLALTTRDLLHKDAEARLSTWLLQRVPPLPEGTTETTLTLAERKRDIAAQLGITPETLSRLLRSLTRKGLIDVIGYSVRLLDLPRLRELADS
jgi:CRP-like cAMP-binding protein